MAAVWFAVRKRHQTLSFTDSAQLGFLSGFYGLHVANLCPLIAMGTDYARKK